jgi:hypothetical protein
MSVEIVPPRTTRAPALSAAHAPVPPAQQWPRLPARAACEPMMLLEVSIKNTNVYTSILLGHSLGVAPWGGMPEPTTVDNSVPSAKRIAPHRI